jgi:hypothetical protein
MILKDHGLVEEQTNLVLLKKILILKKIKE